MRSSIRDIYLSEDEILNKFVQICLGVKFLHDRHILHRDIKAKNCFITKKGLINLGDFGISCVMNQNEAKSPRAFKGTLLNMAPEVLRGKQYSYPADIWSLGIVLYRLCSLDYPWDKNEESKYAYRACNIGPRPIPQKFNDNLWPLIEKMLMKDPLKRPTIN